MEVGYGVDAVVDGRRGRANKTVKSISYRYNRTDSLPFYSL